MLDGDHRQSVALEYGTLSLPQKLPQSRCLLAIHEKVCSLIEQWQPDELAIEAIIYVQSHRTAITMGSARAATVLAAARCKSLYQASSIGSFCRISAVFSAC